LFSLSRLTGKENGMHSDHLHSWQHDHTFGQDRKRPGELRTLIVIGITGIMMVAEISTGVLFGSMALLADGLHMASHMVALSINAFAYAYARRHAQNAEYSFGTGKVNALGGFSGAVLLAVFALLMAWESFDRLIHPVEIVFNQAIFVAVLGLIVNGLCVFILGVDEHHHDHDHDHDHSHSHSHNHSHDHSHDHNLKSAYLHVLADALTSVLAIVALFTAKYVGLIWMDPAMGIVGAILVARWSLGLLRTTSETLLDRQGPESVRQQIREKIEADGDSQIVDLHLWSIGPSIYSVVVSVVAHVPSTPDEYKARIPQDLGIAHITVEIHACTDGVLQQR
jgi:cation diffusion facilitator family transporter